jgi:polyhydroxyalkanoate synthesis regulator phasin
MSDAIFTESFVRGEISKLEERINKLEKRIEALEDEQARN